MTKDKDLLFEKKGAIAYITLNRPSKLNAMNKEIYDLMGEAVEEYVADDDLRCAIITGAGGNFSSGADQNWLNEEKKERGPDWHYDYPGYKALQSCLKPVIAAIDGYCLFSAFLCALLYCDIRIASERVKLGLPVVKTAMGVGDAYAMPFHWYMNLGEALYMLLTGKHLSAEEALRMGIVNEVVPHEKLMERATELATTICECAPMHVRAFKQLSYRVMESPASSACLHLQEMIWHPLHRAEDSAEGRRAFLEKRKPVYKNR